jgi:endonuclease-3
MDKTERIVRILNTLKKEKAFTMLGDMSRKYDAFKILVSTILSARSRDEVTYPICEELFKKYPNAEKLANANAEDVEKIIKKIGFYRQKRKYIIETAKKIREYKGKVPSSMDKLIKLPGVGRKVAGCVIVYAFGKDAIPVDVHVNRISNRTGLVKTKSPEKTEIELMKITPKKYWQLVNDLFVWHGKTTCKPRIPECDKCKIIELCLFKDKNLKN